MSFFSRLFSGSKKEPSSLDIVSEYGAALETAQMGWTGTRDLKDLPYEKARIKRAIFDAAIEFRDFPEQLEMLGAGLAMLGTFQSSSSGVFKQPSFNEIKKMSKDDLRNHAQLMSERTGDLPAAKAGLDETANDLAEWKIHLKSLGVSDA